MDCCSVGGRHMGGREWGPLAKVWPNSGQTLAQLWPCCRCDAVGTEEQSAQGQRCSDDLALGLALLHRAVSREGPAVLLVLPGEGRRVIVPSRRAPVVRGLVVLHNRGP